MSKEQFKKILLGVIVIEGALIGAFSVRKMPLLALITFVVALWLVYFLKTRVKGIMEDEMILMNAGRAALKVYQIFGLVITSLGMVLVSFGQSKPTLYLVGITLTISSCFLLLLYAGIYAYYTRDLRENSKWK